MIKPLELLAPARDADTARAAIAAGADAVFIGGPAFGARAAAGNDTAAIQDLCAYAHRFAVKIHLTLNTLLTDAEIQPAQDLIYAAKEAGVDALIVQDPAVFTLDIPAGLELHVSTQCNADTVDKLKFYAALGCAQAVLPREFSLAEIKECHAACPDLRLEVFAAGALCVGQSGICHISELMTGRSANRGECAQICRLPMTLIGPDGREIKTGHLLSLKDNLALERLEDLIAAGVSSFKLEGRLKDPLYVTNLTAAFSERLDAFIAEHPQYCRSSLGRSVHHFVPAPEKTFNRGFTSAYLDGSNDKLYADKTPKSAGVPIGQVSGVKPLGQGMVLTLKLNPGVKLTNGDACTYFAPNGELMGFRINAVQSQQSGTAQVQLSQRCSIKAHTALRRNVDAAFERELKHKNACVRTLDLKCQLEFKDGRAVVSYQDARGRLGQAEGAVLPPVPENPPLSEDLICAKSRRCQDAGCRVTEVKITGAEQACLPVSAFNELRRAAFADYVIKAQLPAANAPTFKLPDPLPRYPLPEIDRRLILNQRALEFYRKAGAQPCAADAPELRTVMTCRNCLIKNYARCFREGGRVQGYKLRIGRQLFTLRCRCRECRMEILADA